MDRITDDRSATQPDAAATAQLAVDVRALVVRRGRAEVLHGLDLRVPVGQVVGVLGPSGGGKSTLLRSVVGVQQTHGGEVLVFGVPAGSAPLRRQVGYVTQSPSIYDDLTARENVAYFARLLGVTDVAGEVDRVLGLVDLSGHASQRVDHMSGGQRGRASLACALVGSPRLLVLDEPTVGLDPVLRRSLWDLFHRLAADGVTLLVSSHVMDEALHCDRLVLLRDGRVLADETPDDLLASTGAPDPERAFLALIDGTAPTTLPPAHRPRHAAPEGVS